MAARRLRKRRVRYTEVPEVRRSDAGYTEHRNVTGPSGQFAITTRTRLENFKFDTSKLKSWHELVINVH